MSAIPPPRKLLFESGVRRENPYVDVELNVTFEGPGGQVIRRPAYWMEFTPGVTSGGWDKWAVRYLLPAPGRWSWRSTCSDTADPALHGRTGEVTVDRDETVDLLTMSPGGRNLLRRDGRPFFMVADTAWSIPFRATPDEVEDYAADRQAKGFNAVLMMSLQPDRRAEGPTERGQPTSFARAFDDLPAGRLRRIRPDYFDHLDRLIAPLIAHGIVPVWQPVFHGFGWKGQQTLGPTLSPDDAKRYMRYLIARYGAWPAMWLVGGDGPGTHPSVAAAGEECEAADAYGQPTGIHYEPHTPAYVYQDQPWLDFQWCQTGHDATDDVFQVTRLYDLKPTKGAANGEPTYERMTSPDRGHGWWQGDQAWQQLMAGGTMGVVYGAASLWQWRHTRDEPGWGPWCCTDADWREAMQFPGSTFVGHLAKVLEGLDFPDIQVRRDLAGGRRCLAKPGELYVVYLPNGGNIPLGGRTAAMQLRWFDPREGTFSAATVLPAPEPGQNPWAQPVHAPSPQPWVLIATRQ